ncbi:UDP-N-acetylglucosamine 1-carboxyvinyltransferase [Natranaerovirga pectinivora]|uniref:UDP-N-acetylglucosamine 1-carboxyvinyltransferase n=1 Tax=Natranaerovirga pectinivora TaxID=682400 RepID=A0A4R3MJS4_9FIRM|nr:UDP-N-acetylglucosamine 1-carboxyvinyltransferase [Natranaerovirga pectinivora]TCT12851.1 UDP-N-acetylglucosamine 1-carboxyvinyltransferase [Natranaerovirga pectinivora]
MSQRELLVERSTLKGKIKLSGAKNSALRLQAASILTDEELIISNFPNGLSDVKIHNEMLESLGKKIDAVGDTLIISGGINSSELIWNKRSIRNTLLIWGALLARKGFSKVPLPGGCKIGERKYDLHQMVLESLGARVWVEDDYLCAESNGRLKGADIHLPLRSTGATENAILSSSLAIGKTTIWNPHIRPEILDLIDMLNKMGANIEVRGNESIVVYGVEKLHTATHKVIPDNMEALTFLVAAAITDGDVEILDFPSMHLEIPLIFLKSSGLNIYEGQSSVIIKGSTSYPLEISTGPYPGINSDMQPLLAVYSSQAKGMSKIVDLRFPDRFGYAAQLKKMGVDTNVENNLLVIKGGNSLTGADVFADDLRAGAALLLAGLVSDGITRISNAEQIERGYENFIEKFQSLGAKIKWSNYNN